MTTAVATTARSVRTAAAPYLRLDVTTGTADVIHGAQAAFLIDDALHAGLDITPGRHGMVQVRDDEGRSIQYMPVRQFGVPMRPHPHYAFSTSPNGRRREERGRVDGKTMARLASTAPGRVYTLSTGMVVAVCAERCVARWVPVSEES
jgi:hypothetical protein